MSRKVLKERYIREEVEARKQKRVLGLNHISKVISQEKHVRAQVGMMNV